MLSLGWLTLNVAEAQAGMVSRDLSATTLIHYSLSLGAGCHNFETTNPSPSGVADPMMHIWGTVAAGETPRELDRDDDTGGNWMAKSFGVVCLASTRSIQVIVYATTATGGGRVDLVIDGTTRVTQGKIGSVKVDRPTTFVGPTPMDLDFETAFQPAGCTDTRVYGFNAYGKLLGFDDDGGVGMQSRLRASTVAASWTTVDHVRVAAYSESDEGLVSLYINDLGSADEGSPNDVDGDGLGKSLEAALGTCDAPSDGVTTCPAWFYGAAAASYTGKDTDRDGLTDSEEIFGVDDATKPQYLPRWGANPLHKDVFIEMDWRFAATLPVEHTFLAAAQARYSVAPADHVFNPDGLDGVSLHVDNGKYPMAPLPPTTTLFGNWGGSNRVTNESLTHGPQYALEIPATSPRFGIFRYALADVPGSGGGNAAPGGAHFGFGVPTVWDSYSVYVFVHELGHTLNLDHWGERTGKFGPMNCNPLYRSLMNYMEKDEGFSKGLLDGELLDPSAMNETSVAPTFDWNIIGAHPYFYDVVPLGAPIPYAFDIDFNRDGAKLNPPSGWSRAAFPWPATGYEIGCATHSQKARPLTLPTAPSTPRPFLTTTAPRMVRTPGKLYVFRHTTSGIVPAWTERTLPNDNGSCANEFGATLDPPHFDKTCDNFGPDLPPLPGTSTILGFSALAVSSGTILVSYQTSAGDLYALDGTVASDGSLTWSTAVLIASAARSEPEVTELNGDMSSPSGLWQTIVYVRSDYTYAWRRRSSGTGTWGAEEQLLEEGGAAISGTAAPFGPARSLPPTFSQTGMYPVSILGPGPIRTCAILPSGTGNEARFYCYVPATGLASGRFRRHPDAFLSYGVTRRLDQKASLALHFPRTSDGQVWTSGPYNVRAQFWAGIPTTSSGEPPLLYLSSSFDFGAAPIPDGLIFAHNSSPLTDDTISLGMTTLHETQDATGLRAAYFHSVDGVAVSLKLSPLVDGGWHASLTDGSDFKVMERGICLISVPSHCNTLNEWGY